MLTTDQLSMSRPINPSQHAMLDYGVALSFFALVLRFRHRNRAASVLAFLNGALVLGTSVLTDYPGGLWPTLSFKTHRMMDIGQAALAGSGPLLFGFAHTAEARVFYLYGASEGLVVAATDWEGAMPA